jgi:hypothetical protein
MEIITGSDVHALVFIPLMFIRSLPRVEEA